MFRPLIVGYVLGGAIQEIKPPEFHGANKQPGISFTSIHFEFFIAIYIEFRSFLLNNEKKKKTKKQKKRM